jgi:hypothetical protein
MPNLQRLRRSWQTKARDAEYRGYKDSRVLRGMARVSNRSVADLGDGNDSILCAPELMEGGRCRDRHRPNRHLSDFGELSRAAHRRKRVFLVRLHSCRASLRFTERYDYIPRLIWSNPLLDTRACLLKLAYPCSRGTPRPHFFLWLQRSCAGQIRDPHLSVRRSMCAALYVPYPGLRCVQLRHRRRGLHFRWDLTAASAAAL